MITFFLHVIDSVDDSSFDEANATYKKYEEQIAELRRREAKARLAFDRRQAVKMKQR